MFSLASDARPQLQVQVPEAQAENKNVVGSLEIWIREDCVYFPKGLISKNPSPGCYYQHILTTDFPVLYSRVSSYIYTSLLSLPCQLPCKFQKKV